MKASTFLKALVVLVAIGVIVYIIHNSNKAAEINNLVSAPAEPYEFSLRVDSMCETIKKAPDLVKAKQAYDRIYEEMDVYAQIKTNNGDDLIDNAEQNKLFAQAFNAYWPKIEQEADNLFNQTDWTPYQNKTLRAEIKRLVPDRKTGKYNRGILKTQKDALEKYNEYFSGYESFSALLNALENCTDARTYERHKNLSQYNKFPYNKLSKLQTRKSNARSNAQEHWKNELKTQWHSLNNRTVSLTKAEVQQFSVDVDAWETKVESYSNTTNDGSSFSQMKSNIENKVQNLIFQLSEELKKQEEI